MSRDEHVGEREQTGEHVVVENVTRPILEEERSFFFVDVQGERADLAALQPVDHGGGIDQRPTAGVDEHEAALATRDRVGVDEVVRAVEQGSVERDDVALRPHLLEPHVRDPELDQRLVDDRVERQHTTAEMPQDAPTSAPMFPVPTTPTVLSLRSNPTSPSRLKL